MVSCAGTSSFAWAWSPSRSRRSEIGRRTLRASPKRTWIGSRADSVVRKFSLSRLEFSTRFEITSGQATSEKLHNALERALLVCPGGEIRLEDLPRSVAHPGIDRTGPSCAELLVSAESWDELMEGPLVTARAEIADRFERKYLEHVLRKTHGRLRDAAKHAHVDERTLYARMKRHGLSKEQFRL